MDTQEKDETERAYFQKAHISKNHAVETTDVTLADDKRRRRSQNEGRQL